MFTFAPHFLNIPLQLFCSNQDESGFRVLHFAEMPIPVLEFENYKLNAGLRIAMKVVITSGSFDLTDKQIQALCV